MKAYDSYSKLKSIAMLLILFQSTVYANIILEAESGSITEPMQVVTSSEASGGEYIVSTVGGGGEASYTFTVANTGDYYIWALAKAENGKSDSFYIKMAGGKRETFDIKPIGGANFIWDQVCGRASGDPWIFNLDAGTHTLIVQCREADTELDKLVITNDADYSPTPVDTSPKFTQFFYLIPNNRTAQSDAESLIQNWILKSEEWFSNEMERHGFGGKTFFYETEADGVTPKVKFHYAPYPDTYFQGSTLTQNCKGYLSLVGELDLTKPSLTFAETHIVNPDGSFQSGTTTGRSGVVGADYIQRLSWDMLKDNSFYDGQVIPGISEYPLIQDVTFPWFAGTTLSSISSRAVGAAMHELGHTFGLNHDSRNDRYFANSGNVMYLGLSGARGAFYPTRYPDNFMILSRVSALILNTHPAFDKTMVVPEIKAPNVTIHTSDSNVAINGRIPICFTASDNTELSLAVLSSGSFVAHLELDGTDITTEIWTEYYQPNVSQEFTLLVYDIYNNHVKTKFNITPVTDNMAPRPHVKLSKLRVKENESVTIDASKTEDLDGPVSSLIFEWDIDGDGSFDFGPFSTDQLNVSYPQAGNYLIQVKVTDAQGGYAFSSEVPIQVTD